MQPAAASLGALGRQSASSDNDWAQGISNTYSLFYRPRRSVITCKGQFLNEEKRVCFCPFPQCCQAKERVGSEPSTTKEFKGNLNYHQTHQTRNR